MADSEIVLFSTLAVQGPLQRHVLTCLPKGLRVRAVFDPTSILLQRIESGEMPDVIVAVTSDVDRLLQQQLARSATVLARTGVGIGAATQAPRPDVSSVAQLMTTLCTARSVAYSQSGASGKYFAGLIDRLGIADQVNARATIVERGFTGHAVLDGRADLAIQQISELHFVDGIEVAGPLPEEVQHYTEFSAACFADATDEATALVQALTTVRACDAYRQSGLDC